MLGSSTFIEDEDEDELLIRPTFLYKNLIVNLVFSTLFLEWEIISDCAIYLSSCCKTSPVVVASLLVICYKWKVLAEKSILLYPSTQGYKPDFQSLELNWFGQKYFTDVICSFDRIGSLVFFIACTCMPLMLVFRSLRPVEHTTNKNRRG